MNSILSKYLFFYPVRFARGEHVYKYMKHVRQIEKMDENEIRNYQLNKIQEVISYSYDKIPYYRELFDKIKLSVNDINDEKDLYMIPTLSKDDIRKNMDKLKDPAIRELEKRSTSGSTGQPLIFYKDRTATAYMDAVMYHTYSWHGVNIGDRQARFWGMPIKNKEKIVAIAKDIFMNRIRLSAFDLNEKSLAGFYKKIVSFNPNYFYGYPNLIHQFALFIENKGIIPQLNKLKMIITTGEVLLDNHKRKIEEIFDTRVINEYGCSETGVVGFECKEGNMHLMAHNIFIEIIKDDKHVVDEEGEIYITELHSKSFPFIRYKIGDRGNMISEKCSCGITLPLIKITCGRSDDYIITPDGRKVYDAILAYTFKKGVDSFMAVQKEPDRLDIYIIKNSDLNKRIEKEYFQLLQKKLGESMNIKFIFVDRINREKSGKLRYFRSDIR